ncbi:alpha-E domain-containing protein [Marinomonas piezotolerans]|uniref:Alpha-E domain-containing protein n=1 Tax=Marinomonas piezotolerans TaxID=2213058 RepID=A0A370U983_9GAMM|nr:alpha-E domain-containing protein [Marinomonas piezotolerans]RDL44308.1 alpha-E domain-containing protein [Marinomonas piezotolerans]
MLSRVAERLYWSARYLERVENTARLVSVYDDLLFDLPPNVAISWYNLIEINSGVEAFNQRYKIRDEHNVVKFLLSDDTNSSSLLSSLKMVRENIRTSRDVMPGETWELINELDMYARENIKRGINRSDRHAYLNTIVEGCQKIIGLFAATMDRDAGWSFLILGRYLERADMNTRIIDAANTLMLQSRAEEAIELGQVVWSKVLKSQSAYLSFRRTMRTSISGARAVTFLLTDPNFPRSQQYCIGEIKNAASALPRAGIVLVTADNLLNKTQGIEHSSMLNEDFSEYLNQVQLDIISLHHQITENWFNFKQGDAA